MIKILFINFTKFCMEFRMRRIIFKKHQVFNSIIISNVVYVMNNFSKKKISPNVSFHYKAMFSNVTFLAREWMIIYFNMNIFSKMWGRIYSYKIIFSKIFNMFFRKLLTFSCFTQVFKPLFTKRFSFLSKIGKSNLYFVLFGLRPTLSKIAFPNIRTFFRTAFPSIECLNPSIKYCLTNNTRFIHVLSLFSAIITFNIISCQESFATDEWRNSTGALTVLGSSNASDLDTNIYNNIVSPLDRLLANYREGFSLTYNSAGTLNIGSGSITCSNSDGSIRKMRRNTAGTTTSFSDLDTGAEGSSTTYYVYLNCDASTTTATIKISASSTSPSGITYYKRLGYFLNDSSSNITDIHNDNQYAESGTWASKSANVVYQALTDGIVVAQGSGSTNAPASFTITSDSSSSPSTVRAQTSTTSSTTQINTTLTIPVKRGDYYEVNTSGAQVISGVYFLPISS